MLSFSFGRRPKMYTVDRVLPADDVAPESDESVLVSPGLPSRRLRAPPRLRLVSKSGALNVISEHLTWWNPLSFNNAIRHISSVLSMSRFFICFAQPHTSMFNFAYFFNQ